MIKPEIIKAKRNQHGFEYLLKAMTKKYYQELKQEKDKVTAGRAIRGLSTVVINTSANVLLEKTTIGPSALPKILKDLPFHQDYQDFLQLRISRLLTKWDMNQEDEIKAWHIEEVLAAIYHLQESRTDPQKQVSFSLLAFHVATIDSFEDIRAMFIGSYTSMYHARQKRRDEKKKIRIVK